MYNRHPKSNLQGLDENADITDIRKVLEEKDYVMFHTKEELLEKVSYYLSHEEERLKMVQRGRKAALAKMTYDSLMKRVLDTVAERLEE